MTVTERPTDEFGRAVYDSWECPPADAHYALWRGALTHPSAVHTPPTYGINPAYSHDALCRGGWIGSGEWWLHCGRCRPEKEET